MKQIKQQDDAQVYINRQLMQHIKEKHECQKRLEEVEKALAEVCDRYELVKREHAAVLDTNKMLEKKARDLSQES